MTNIVGSLTVQAHRDVHMARMDSGMVRHPDALLYGRLTLDTWEDLLFALPQDEAERLRVNRQLRGMPMTIDDSAMPGRISVVCGYSLTVRADDPSLPDHPVDGLVQRSAGPRLPLQGSRVVDGDWTKPRQVPWRYDENVRPGEIVIACTWTPKERP